jgi:serine/threonine-protein kinase
MSERDEVATVPDPDAAQGILPPLAIGRYDIGARIGKGGMGEIFLAQDLTIGREVAIKRLISPDASERALARFLREARIQARLDHPAIVPVHELGADGDGRPYIVMKRLTGQTMRTVLGDDYSKQRLLRAFVEVCFAVEYAHARGVIHRDLKPENIMLGDFGEVYVLDWGVAKVVGQTDDVSPVSGEAHLSGDAPRSSDARLSEPREKNAALSTRAGAIIGTPEYMAPEQARAETDIDPRADVYALGRILCEVLTDSDAVVRRPSQIEREVPFELDELCARALIEDRTQRLGSVRQLGLGVQAYLDGDRDLERRRTLAATHLEQAQGALAESDNPAQRVVAMREAGRALALDPTRTEAADLIGNLMIEPPKKPPDEVQRDIEAERIQLRAKNSRSVQLTLGAFLVMILNLYVTTEAEAPLVAIAASFTAVLIGLAAWQRRRPALRSKITIVIVIGLAIEVVTFCRLFPPFLIAPTIGAMLAIATPFTMQHDKRWFSAFLAVMMIVGILVPYLGEHAGLFPPTFTVVPEGVLLHTGALRGSELWQIANGVSYIILTITFCTWMGHTARQSEHRARHQLHLQAWHLRQLVAR